MPTMEESMPELFMTEAQIRELDWEQDADRWTVEGDEKKYPPGL